MKKKILGLSIVLGSALLTSCTDPSDDNSSQLQNNLVKNRKDGLQSNQMVGINQASIPGFENNSGTTPTQVTVTYSGGVVAAKAAGCLIFSPDQGEISTGLTDTAPSFDASSFSYGFDSLLGALDCSGATTGTYTADVNISFTAGSKSYTANTTLTATT